MSKAKRQRKQKAARKRFLREERQLDRACYAMMALLQKELGLQGEWQEFRREDEAR